MRKLTWFAGGFAMMCLLLVWGAPVGYLMIPGVPLVVGWQKYQPKSREDWMEVRGYHPRRYWLWQVCRRGAAVAAGCVAGLCWFSVYYYMVCLPAQTWVGDQSLSGIVISQPQMTSTGSYSLVMRLDDGVDVHLYAPASWREVQLGDHVQVEAQVEQAPVAYGEELLYYTAKGVFLMASCEQAPTVEHPSVLPWPAWPTWVAQRLKEGIETAFDQTVAPLAVAVTLGEKNGLPDGVYQDMTRAGVLHAAVVSGLHISFLVGILTLCLRGNGRWGIALIPVLLFYAFMAGATPSAFRAVWMQGTVLAVPWVRREQDSPSALALALLLLLMLNPYSVASAGLQLSFLSVMGILLVTERIYTRMTKPLEEWKKRNGWRRLVRRGWQWGSASIAVSLGAMALTTPLCGFLFGQVSLLAPVVNILVLWALTGLMVCALGLGFLALCLPGIATLLGQVAGMLGHYALWMIHRFGTLPHGVLRMDNLYHMIWLVGAYAVGGLVLWGGVHGVQMLLAGGGLAVALALPVGLSALTVAQCDLMVVGLDVGQGSSTLLLSGDATVLVDCGGSLSTSAGDIAADYLNSVGRDRVDVLLLTHLDEDHFNGVQRLLDRVQVGQVLVPDSDLGQKQARTLEGWLEERDIPYQWVGEETKLTLETLHIRAIPPLGSGTTNEEGLSALCTVNDFDVLITGDADSYVEHMIVRYFVIPNIELLVVGHHGSADSTGMELLGWARPELGILSVGEDNPYGHPDPETLERLRRSGVEVHRTDLEGTVTVAVQGDQVGIW